MVELISSAIMLLLVVMDLILIAKPKIFILNLTFGIATGVSLFYYRTALPESPILSLLIIILALYTVIRAGITATRGNKP